MVCAPGVGAFSSVFISYRSGRQAGTWGWNTLPVSGVDGAVHRKSDELWIRKVDFQRAWFNKRMSDGRLIWMRLEKYGLIVAQWCNFPHFLMFRIGWWQPHLFRNCPGCHRRCHLRQVGKFGREVEVDRWPWEDFSLILVDFGVHTFVITNISYIPWHFWVNDFPFPVVDSRTRSLEGTPTTTPLPTGFVILFFLALQQLEWSFSQSPHPSGEPDAQAIAWMFWGKRCPACGSVIHTVDGSEILHHFEVGISSHYLQGF